jgi:hypothetical protein
LGNWESGGGRERWELWVGRRPGGGGLRLS